MSLQETPIQVHNPAPAGAISQPMQAGPPTFDDPSKSNFADDEEAMQWIRQNALQMMEYARYDRQTLDAEWQEIQKMSFMRHGTNRKYQGMSDAYIPAYAKNASTRTRHTAAALFPSDDYLDATAMDPQFAGMEAGAKAWMQYQLSCQAKLRSNMKPFLRQLFDFGITCGKLWYQKEPAQNKRGSKKKIAEQLMAVFSPQQDKFSGLRFRTVSMFTWWIWPTTIDNIEQASITFEDVQVSMQYANAMVKAGEWKNADAVQRYTANYTSDTNRQIQEETIRGSGDVPQRQKIGELGDWLTISEVYCRMPVPKDQYRDGEQVGDAVPCQLFIINDTPVVARRNPFWFQHAPYVMKSDNTRADSFYGIGLGRQGMGMQGLINDLVNQANDNGIMAMNPVAIINPNLMIGKPKMSPGAPWYCTDIDKAFKFDRPPFEQVQMGQAMASTQSAWMSDLLGTPPIMQGTSGKGAAKTATGSEILQNNTKTDIQDDVEDIEEEVLGPLMEMAWALGQQYESAEKSVVIAGMNIKIPQDTFAGDYAFQWRAASQVANAQQRAQNSFMFLQSATNPAVAQALMQQGLMVNPVPILREGWTHGLGQRNFEEIVQPMPQMGMPGMPPGQPPMPGQPGMPGQPSPYDTNAGTSANHGAPPQAGEGEAFASVRDNADQMAAQAGAAPSGGLP